MATTTYDLKIDGNENEHQLLAKLYDAATAIGNEQLSSIAACIVRIANSLKNELRAHRVAHGVGAAAGHNVPPGPYVAPDNALIDAWIADVAKDLHEQFQELGSEFDSIYAQSKIAGNAAGMPLQRARMRRSKLMKINAIMRRGLLAAVQGKTLLDHLANKDYIRNEIAALDQISSDDATRVVTLTSVRLIIDIFSILSKRGTSNNTVALSLLKTMHPSKQSFEDMITHMHRGKQALLAQKPADAAHLLDMIMAMQASTFIANGATSTTMPTTFVEAYRSVLDNMEQAADKQHGPLTFSQMETFGDQLRIALESRQLPSVPAKPAKSTTSAAQAGTDTIEARLRKLEDVPPKPPDKPASVPGARSGRGRKGRVVGRGGRGAAAGAGAPQFKCLCCGKFGCVPSTCPHANEEARREYKERKAAREAAREGVNSEKAMRRLQQGALAVGVSEDEVSSGEENVDNCLPSLSSSLSPPSSSVPMLGVIHYQMPLEMPAVSASLEIEVLNSLKHITVAPALPPYLRAGLVQYNDLVVHLYNTQCTVQPSTAAGAVVDTGAQRGAAKYKSEIVTYTGKSHSMVGALGTTKSMPGIVMGCETRDITGKVLTIIVPDESVSDASLTDSLIPVGRLKEAGFKVIFRIPSEAPDDGVSLTAYPTYGGFITTPAPQSHTIYMEYVDHTWRLPLPTSPARSTASPVSTLNAFSVLATKPEAHTLSPSANDEPATRSDADQRRFELMCKRQQEAAVLHEAHGHRNPTSLVRDLKAAGVPVKHLQRYIHAHRCKFCDANLGRAAYQTAKQSGGGDLVISTIVDPTAPQTAITKTLADEHQVTSAPPSDSSLRPFKTILTKGKLTTGLDQQLAELNACVDELAKVGEKPNCSPAGTDLRIDWADACSLGRQGERYFLLIVDKDTEYLVNFNTKSRQNPVDLLRSYINTTGKKPRYLRVDGAKEFVSDDMTKFCTSENIILQTVVAYNHTMQARVEGAIGYVKQHSRVSMLTANVPTRFWPQATTDFVIKRNLLWYSEQTPGKWSTPHQRMRPALASALTRQNVAIPFGCRVTSTIPREHRRVVNGSFGDRFVEGIYLHADTQTPTIRMYDIASRTELSVKDFKYYPEQFPFRDPTCLTRTPDALRKELAAMHAEDDADDQLIAEQLQVRAVTRSQTEAADRAREHAIVPVEPTRAQALPAPAALSKAPKAQLPGVTTVLSDMHEMDLARDFVRYKYPVTLPPRYNPPSLPLPKGEMVVIAVKAQRQTKDKAVVWVEFLSPLSHKGHQMQLYPKSLERKNGPAQGADFSLLSAVREASPFAKTWSDLGVVPPRASAVTTAALAALSAYAGGTRFTADALSASASETSEQSPSHLHFLATDEQDASPLAPPGYTRGMQDPKHRGHMLRSPIKDAWITAERQEMEGLARRKVWVRVHRSKLTAQDKVFSTRFHYKIKRKNGNFDKCKVRLVVQGQHMHKKDEQGVGDFEDAFSPVPHASGFRTILALATQHDMHCDHVDISQAFVQGDLLPGDGYQGKVYISPPKGFDEDPDYVYELRRPLYGMPSAARAWHTTMSSYLKDQGCKTVGFERSMWTTVRNGHTILITAHIDDFILACSDRATLDDFRTALLARFDGTYEGEIHSYLGCEIRREDGKTLLSQRHYAEDVLRTYDAWDCIPALTPMRPGARLTKEQCNLAPDASFHRRYRGIVGSLGYLVNMTRPDLAWSYSELSKYVQYPGQDHMDAANHVLRYLRGTCDQAIVYTRSDKAADVLWGWVDSDWAADLDSRRSHTGYVIMLTGGAISWKSRRQDCVSLSTSEAEYVAASQCGQEVLYLREILRDFGFAQAAPTEVYEDNLACVAMSENPVRRKFSRHIDIRYYFVRDLVAHQVMKLVPLRTHNMVADQLTKSLPAPALVKHRDVMIGRVPFCARSLCSATSVSGG